MSEMALQPGAWWFAGVVIVDEIQRTIPHNAPALLFVNLGKWANTRIDGDWYLEIDPAKAEAVWLCESDGQAEARVITHARGLWTPDTGTHPGTPPESAWPDAQGKVSA
jgi:hypothetical protein